MFTEFVYYQRISIKEGLDIESEKPQLERYDKTKSRKCTLCSKYLLSKKKKKIKDNDSDCNQCFKITNGITKTRRMYVIWKENVKYRVYTNLYRTDADHLKKKEEPNVNKYVESLNSFFETQTPKSTLDFFWKIKDNF